MFPCLIDNVASGDVLVQLPLDLVEFERSQSSVGGSDEGMCFKPLGIIFGSLSVEAIGGGLLL